MSVNNTDKIIIITNKEILENKKAFLKIKTINKSKSINRFLKCIIISSLSFYLYLLLLFEYYYKIERHPQDIFKNHRVFIEAHRGLNKEIFENTMEAFSKSILNNIEALETDCWVTKDNIPVLIHAAPGSGDISKLYDHVGNVMDLSWDELSTYRTKKDNLTIPRLRDLFKLAKNKIFINLEIKDPRIDITFPLIMNLIEEFEFFDQISLSSFRHEYYYKVLEYNKNNKRNIVFGNLYSLGRNNFNYTRRGSALNIYWRNASKEVCDKAHENGMAVLVYFNIKDIENYQIYNELINYGVDVICSNDPIIAKTYRDNYYIKSKINKIFFKPINDFKKLIIKYSKLFYN